jgi:hypothetical protein
MALDSHHMKLEYSSRSKVLGMCVLAHLSLIQQLYRNSNAAHSCDLMSVRKPEVVSEGAEAGW